MGDKMKNSLLLVAVAALSLTACDRPTGNSAEKEKNTTAESGNSASEDGERNRDGEGNREAENNRDDSASREENDRGSGRDDEGGGSDRRGSGGSEEEELRAALQQAAREQRARLPLRDGVTTVYDAEAEGTDFIVSLRIAEDFDEEQFERLERAFQRSTCEGDSADLIRLGATTVYRVTDSEGERRTFRISSC